jgi:GMP synthase-like glutamine amidotransferase
VVTEDLPEWDNFYENLFFWDLFNPGDHWKFYLSHTGNLPTQ